MNNQLVRLKIKNRLNKLDSDDLDNIPNWQIAEAFNKAQREWVRRQLRGYNQTRTGREETSGAQADLQQLLKEWTAPFVKKSIYFESTTFPDDYLVFARVSAKAGKGCCCPRPLILFQGEESDVDINLMDDGRKPSYSWRTTFYTLFGDKIRIYTNGEFDITEPLVSYYRKPRNIVFNGSTDPETGVLAAADVTCEFKDEIVELIIDEAASILGGDLDDNSQFQRGKINAERNT